MVKIEVSQNRGRGKALLELVEGALAISISVEGNVFSEESREWVRNKTVVPDSPAIEVGETKECSICFRVDGVGHC